MDEEKEYIDNYGLIFLAIKNLHLYWKNEDELQEYKDYGSDGLLKGIRTYDSSKNTKRTTYYYECIRNELLHLLLARTRKKRTGKVISYNAIINDDGDELIDLLPSDLNIEEDIETKIRDEKLLDIINHLPLERDRWVIKYLYGLDGYEKLTTVELAKRWGVSKQCITGRKTKVLGILWRKIKGKL